MKLKTLLLSSAVIVGFGATTLTADAAGNFYISGGAGLSMPNNTTFSASGVSVDARYKQPGFAGNLAIGYKLPKNFRVEGEFGYKNNSIKDVATITVPAGTSLSTSVFSYMVNAFYDFPTGTKFVPYVGAGLGAATVQFSGTGNGIAKSDSNTGFAYQLGAGVGYNLSDTVQVFTDYRFMGVPSVKFDNVKVNYNNHSVIAGLRVSF